MLQVDQLLCDRYQLQRSLNENASQQTWLALDRHSQPPERVIVKLLAITPDRPWEQAKLLAREAQVLQRLDHPRIPRYRDYFELDQLADSRFLWFGLVQDQVPGESLQQSLDRGRRFTAAEIEQIATETLDILDYLHHLQPPILHRDIKPSNLIRGTDGHIYLIDFGSVQDRAALEGVTFTVVGTYGYVPMEQFGGRAVAASDLYALGATLIHLMTGVAPADLPHPHARIQFADRVSVDPGLVAWVGQLTAPDLADRLSTAAQALDTLKHRQHLSLPPTHRQPTGSRIQLKKSRDRLFVKLPPQGWSGVRWGDLLFGCLGTFVLSYLLYGVSIKTLIANVWTLRFLYWSFWVVLGVRFCIQGLFSLLTTFSHTVIVSDRTQFTLSRQLFGINIWHKHINVPNVGSKTARFDILMQGLDLSNPEIAEVEQLWLRQEIQDWLDAGR
jgi:serine/threonine protein kinase